LSQILINKMLSHPNHSRVFDTNEQSQKRAKVFPTEGVAEILNPSMLDVNDDDNIIGMMNNSRSDLVNTSVTYKIFICPTDFPAQNRNTDLIPKGAALFIRAPKNSIERDPGNGHGVEHVPFMHRLHAFAPEQLNLEMAHMAIQPRIQPLSLTECISQFKLIGVMGQGPVDSRITRARAPRSGSLRLVRVQASASTKVVNYWGTAVSGSVNSFLFWVFIETDIPSESTYTVSCDKRCPTLATVNNTYASPVEMRRLVQQNLGKGAPDLDVVMRDYDRVRYVPKLVPRFSDTKSLKREDLMYTVTASDGKTKLTRYGFAMYFGRCIQNSSYDSELVARGVNQSIQTVSNMEASSSLPLIDVLVKPNDRFFS
jgi:hypothetical protein